MSKLRDAAFDDFRFWAPKDCRNYEKIYNPAPRATHRHTVKVTKCKICGALVYPPCVLCHPEMYFEYRIIATLGNQRKYFISLSSFANARYKYGWSSWPSANKLADRYNKLIGRKVNA